VHFHEKKCEVVKELRDYNNEDSKFSCDFGIAFITRIVESMLKVKVAIDARTGLTKRTTDYEVYSAFLFPSKN